MKKTLPCLCALVLSCALLLPTAFAASLPSALTLLYTMPNAHSASFQIKGLDGKTNTYAAQLHLTLSGNQTDVAFIPASPDVYCKTLATPSGGNTDVTVYLDAQTPLNDGAALSLGVLQIGDALSLPTSAQLTLLDVSLTSIGFSNAPTVSVDDGNSGGGIVPPLPDNPGGSDNGGNNGGGTSPTPPGNSGGSGNGGTNGGEETPPTSTGKDQVITADAKGVGTINKSDLSSIRELTVKSGQLTAVFSTAAVAELQKNNSDIEVHLSASAAKEQSRGLLAQTAGMPVYALTLQSNGTNLPLPVGQLTLTVPFSGKGTPVAYTVSRDGLSKIGAQEVKDGLVTVPVAQTGSMVLLDINHTLEDVDGWYDGYVNLLVERGILSGVTNTKFEPQRSMTRAELSATLARMSGDTRPIGEVSHFTDVPPDAWFASYVAWAKQNGITSGTSETEFSPNGSITREQMATMIVRFAAYKGITLPADAAEKTFSDHAEIAMWANSAVTLMQRAGILDGHPDGRFDPHGTATRAECAKMLAVFLQMESL